MEGRALAGGVPPVGWSRRLRAATIAVVVAPVLLGAWWSPGAVAAEVSPATSEPAAAGCVTAPASRVRPGVRCIAVTPDRGGSDTVDTVAAPGDLAAAGDAAAPPTAQAAARTDGAVVAADAVAPVCTGTGSDGFRVQAVYAYVGSPEPSMEASIRDWAGEADDAFDDSAARTGSSRRVRWVTDSGSPGCEITVVARAISAEAAASHLVLFNELWGGGLDDPAYHYLVWTEGSITDPPTSTCGIGEYFKDDRPSPTVNQNAQEHEQSVFAAMDSRCWNINGGHSVPAHELMHTLGAVQDGAPNGANSGHCTDNYDNLCYGPGTEVVAGCTSFAQHERLFDCNNDDYFHTDPATGSYLCTHWNTATSPFLVATPQVPRAVPKATMTRTPQTLRVSWSPSTSCTGMHGYRVELSTGETRVVSAALRSTSWPLPAGSVTATVTAVRSSLSSTATAATLVNQRPVGTMVWSLDRRTLILSGWALDPDSAAAVTVRTSVNGVVTTTATANRTSTASVPDHPDSGPNHGYRIAQGLPPGTHDVCVSAYDTSSGAGNRLGCVRVTVK